jgi:hypothetical protein
MQLSKRRVAAKPMRSQVVWLMARGRLTVLCVDRWIVLSAFERQLQCFWTFACAIMSSNVG